MKIFRYLIIKTILLCFFILFNLPVYAQYNAELQLYNRGEKVQLEKSLIQENDDYFISIDDLSKINIKYIFEENDEGFKFDLYSENAFGTENTLLIDARLDKLHMWDESIGDYVTSEFYWFSNKMISKESLVNPVSIGNFQSIIIKDDVYYISLKAISIAISHEYNVNDNIIKLWITDSKHHVVRGKISLPDEETATEKGINVNIFILNGDDDLTEIYSFKQVCIPYGENGTTYFIETDIIETDIIETDVTNTYRRIMFEFDGNYQTINKFVNLSNGSILNISTNKTEKVEFSIKVSMPVGMTANDDIYATIFFERCAVYKSDEPIINKGEKIGVVTLDIDKEFAGKVAISNVIGDDRIFDYGYYGYGDLKLLSENARTVLADHSIIKVTLLQSYRISGQVIPTDINSGYKVRIFGVTDDKEKVYLYKDVGDDFKFNVKIPESIPEYTLSVAYKPGAYCGYISDGVSDYSGRYHNFENICDYSDIKLKYEPFLPELPIDINASPKTGWVELKNISDDILRYITLYCAHYREDKLIYLSSIYIDNLAPYSEDYNSYRFEYPTEFYKTDKVKFFVWNKNLRPLSDFIAKKVNELYFPEDMEFSDVDLSSVYYESIKDLYLSGVMVGYEDGTFHPDDYVMRNEATAMFCKLLGYWCNAYKFSCDDVPIENWESSFVGICVNEKIFELKDNKFRPHENITVAETYEAIINVLKNESIYFNTSDLLFNINTNDLERDITRGEFAQILYNYKQIVN